MHDLKEQAAVQTANKKSKPIGFILLVVLQCLIYGIANPITKIAYESITPFWCLAFRFSIALILLAAFLPAPLTAVAGLYLLCSNGGPFSFGWGEMLNIEKKMSAGIV